MAQQRQPDFRRSVVEKPTGPVALVLGFLLGAAAGTATLGLEVALLGWMGVGHPDPEGLLVLGATYGLLGGLIGGLHAATGIWGGGWALAWACSALGLSLGAKAGAAVVAMGLPGAIGVVGALIAATAFGQLAGRLGGLGSVQMGIAALLAVAAPALGALNLHLLPSASSEIALAVDLVVVVFAVLVAVAVGAVSSGERAPLGQLFAANVVCFGALWPLIGGLAPTPPTTSKAGTPVVLITVEGLRTDAVSREGAASMPHLSAFLDSSLHFRAAHATAPWAIPSLASLHTGRLPHKHGAAMHDGRVNRLGPLGARVPTAAQVLASEGYLTAAVSGDAFLDSFGLHTGFRWFADTPERGPLPLWLDALALTIGSPPWPVRQDAAAVTDRALAVVRAQSGGRWFLWVHLVDPGGPFLSAEHDRAAIGRTVRPWPVDVWESSLLTTDRELGRLLEGLPADAVVVLAGSHGVELEEERPRLAGVPAGATDGHSLYQELIGVPLAVRGPGIPKRKVDRPVSLIDVLPSLLHRLGVEALPRIDGQVWPELGGKAPEDPVPVLAMSLRWGPELGAVRIGSDKIIVRPDGSGPLFDLADDGREILARPADARNDQLERRLRGALPPMGRGPELFERAGASERLGRWLQASWRRRPGAESAEVE